MTRTPYSYCHCGESICSYPQCRTGDLIPANDERGPTTFVPPLAKMAAAEPRDDLSGARGVLNGLRASALFYALVIGVVVGLALSELWP